MKILRIKNKSFFIEVADTWRKRAKGLMFRKRPAPMHGLLIEFPKPGKWGIWTPFMKFPLDLIFLDEKMQVVDAKGNVPAISILKPKTWKIYRPKAPAKYVLEVAAQMPRQR
jgi:hypothetical protein